MKTITINKIKYKFEITIIDAIPTSNYNKFLSVYQNKTMICGTTIKTNATESEILERVKGLIISYNNEKKKTSIFEL